MMIAELHLSALALMTMLFFLCNRCHW